MTYLRSLLLFILLVLSLPTPALPETAASSPNLPTGTTTDWWGMVQHDLQAREYHASHNGQGLQAPNRRQDFRTYFEADGIRVVAREAAEHEELLRLHLDALGRGETLRAVSAGEVTSQDNRVELRRPGLVEWYENRPEGLEQGFTLAERPTGEGDLVLRLQVSGATVQAVDGGVELRTTAGRRLRYGKLMVRDRSEERRVGKECRL